MVYAHIILWLDSISVNGIQNLESRTPSTWTTYQWAINITIFISSWQKRQYLPELKRRLTVLYKDLETKCLRMLEARSKKQPEVHNANKNEQTSSWLLKIGSLGLRRSLTWHWRTSPTLTFAMLLSAVGRTWNMELMKVGFCVVITMDQFLLFHVW
jgi:hypothetical protein